MDEMRAAFAWNVPLRPVSVAAVAREPLPRSRSLCTTLACIGVYVFSSSPVSSRPTALWGRQHSRRDEGDRLNTRTLPASPLGAHPGRYWST